MLRVFFPAIMAHQPEGLEASSFFRNAAVKRFSKGLNNIRPPIKPTTPQWSLTLVLRQLSRLPFEPMATASERLLMLKAAFLVPITSARRATELAALRVDPPFLQFHPHKVTLYPDVTFQPKVVSDFHVRQPIVLPTFFPVPTNDLEHSMHSLDVHRVLAFYVSHTATFRKPPNLFISAHGHTRRHPVSSQTISK